MKAFTFRKFASLSLQKKHKECAWILQNLFETTDPHCQETYSQYCAWMQEKPFPLKTSKEIADAFHSHIAQAGIRLREPQFLPSISRFDLRDPKPTLGFSVYLDHLRSAHNVGSILRTVEAFRLGRVYFSPTTPWIEQKPVRDASMGTYEFVECQQISPCDLPRPLVALETSSDAHDLHHFKFPDSCTIALGNEEYGCSWEILDRADAIVQIPLRGKKNSLNVANAFAICAAIIANQYDRGPL